MAQKIYPDAQAALAGVLRNDLYWESVKYHFPRVEVPTVLAAWFTQLKPSG